MSTIPQMLETPAPFRAWLEQQPDGRRFEWADICDCPVAKFLHESGYQDALVGVDEYFTDAGYNYRLPNWCIRFIERFDSSEPPANIPKVLSILADVERAL